jgi:hypothetical protein
MSLKHPRRPVLDLPPGRGLAATIEAAASMRDATAPEYLVTDSPWNVPKT